MGPDLLEVLLRGEQEPDPDFALLAMLGRRQGHAAFDSREWLEAFQVDRRCAEGLCLLDLVPVEDFELEVGANTRRLQHVISSTRE